jgi:hypothetical protein
LLVEAEVVYLTLEEEAVELVVIELLDSDLVLYKGILFIYLEPQLQHSR